jgi:hypothetical protein
MRSTVLRNAALVLLLAVAPRAFAHEHMYIGSTQPHGGSLVLSYDFTRDFPLVPAPDGVGFIGTDPAFNAQITDDPANGIYRLKPGTTPKMQITALDPGVTVNFNGIKMTAPGATAKIGRMPYLHQHPDWLLNVPDNVFGEYHLSFRVIAAGYRPSPSYTATLSNIPVATTTTTTIPGQTCLPGACDDHDACTVDSCVGGACQNEPATGIDAVRCRMIPLSNALDDIRPTTRPAQRVSNRLRSVFNSVEPALDAIAAGGKDAPRKLKKAERQLNRFSAVVDRGVELRVLVPDQGDSLRVLAGNVYDQLVLLTPGS